MNEERAAFSAVREATEQTTLDASEALVRAAADSGHQDGLEQLAMQNEQKDNTTPIQEMAAAPPMSWEEAEQIIAAYEALGQAVAQAKATYGRFSQEWLDATQAQRKARPAWWLAQERLAELQREGGASPPSECATVPLLFTETEQIAPVPLRREAATPSFDLAAHELRVLRQAATVAANPTHAGWPAG